MITQEDVLKFEIKRFKEGQGIVGKNQTFRKCLEKAIGDAFMNSGILHKGCKESLLEIIITKYGEDELVKKEFFDDMEASFDTLFDVFKTWSIQRNLKKDSEDGQGRALKFASMVFKYLYCCDEIRSKYGNRFSNCYLPLDNYTLNGWYKKELDKVKEDTEEIKTIKEELVKIKYKYDENKFTWTKMPQTLYIKIQEHVIEILEKGYSYEYDFIGDKITCVIKNRLELDFFVWEQEKR